MSKKKNGESNKKAPPKQLKPKKVDGKIEVLQANKYRGTMIYVRKINEDIFEYLIPHKGQIYANYLIITPQKNKKKLTKEEQRQAVGIIYAGATSTVDVVIKGEDPDKKTKKMVEEFEKVGKKAFNKE